MKLNKEEIIRGFFITLPVTLVLINWKIALIVSMACAVLYAMGGADNSWSGYRRGIIPLVICIPAALMNPVKLLFISGTLMFAVLSIGYGIPTYAPGRPDNDEGSLLGRFWFHLIRKLEKNPVDLVVREEAAKWLTHGTLFLLFFIAGVVPYLIGRKYGW